MPIEPGLTQDGRLPSPPPFEQYVLETEIVQDADTRVYASEYYTKNYSDIIDNHQSDSDEGLLVGEASHAKAQHSLLWDPFFQNYFPKANADWVKQSKFVNTADALLTSLNDYIEAVAEERGVHSSLLGGNAFTEVLEEDLLSVLQPKHGDPLTREEFEDKVVEVKAEEIRGPYVSQATKDLTQTLGRTPYDGEVRKVIDADEGLTERLSALSYSNFVQKDLYNMLVKVASDQINENHVDRVKTISFYKNSFDAYLRSFGTYLNTEEGATDKAVFRGELDLDKDGNAVGIGTETIETQKLEENQKTVWNNYLNEKTDLPFRSKAMYLWIMTDLLDMMNTLTTTILNAQGSQRVLNKAQKQISEQMKRQQLIQLDKIQFFYNPPTNRLVVPQAFSGLATIPQSVQHAISVIDNVPETTVVPDVIAGSFFTASILQATIGIPYLSAPTLGLFGAGLAAATIPYGDDVAKVIPFPELVPFPIGVPYPSVMQHNGVINSRMGVLKALRGKITQLGEEENVNTEGAYKAYQKHNQYITELLGQLDTMLSQFTA